jgi:hypothetical protein
MKRFTLVLLASLLLASPAARAFGVVVTEQGRVARWSVPGLTYVLGTYAPSSIGQSGLNAIDAAFQTWPQADGSGCSLLTFAKTGTTAVTTVLPTGADPNGVNEVIFSKSGAWPHPEGVLGVTVPLFSVDGRILESDIAFSPESYYLGWTTATNVGYGKMNIQGVAVHEIGHFFGLQHVLDYYGYGGSDQPTMVPATEDGVAELSLSDDDVRGTCFLYPTSTYACASASQCPDVIDTKKDAYGNDVEYIKASFSCTSGECFSALVKDGTQGYGQECAETADCQSPLFCQPLSLGQMCTRECSPSADDCPNGDTCVAYQDMANLGVCFPTPHYPLGHECASGPECDSGLCIPNPDGEGHYCRQSCQVSKANCPAGSTCLSNTGIDYGGCIPDELIGPPPGDVGDACTTHDDCASGVCGEGSCRKACTSDGDCGDGMECTFFAGKRGCDTAAVAPEGKDDGQACAAGAECKSGLCATLPGTEFAYCRSSCLPGGACPTGTTCVLYADPAAGVCMPAAHGVGDSCSNNNQCSTAICHSTDQGSRQCVESCRTNEPRCAEGYACADDATYGPVCLPTGPAQTGDTPVGQACEQDGQCQSGLCHEGVCTARCDVFAPSCADGLGCLSLGDGNQGGCVPVGSLDDGEGCAADTDCLSALCVSLGSGGVCVVPCDRTDAACPGGASCIRMGGYDVLGVCYDDGTGGGDGGGTGMCAHSSRGSQPLPLLALLLVAWLGLVIRRSRRA